MRWPGGSCDPCLPAPVPLLPPPHLPHALPPPFLYLPPSSHSPCIGGGRWNFPPAMPFPCPLPLDLPVLPFLTLCHLACPLPSMPCPFLPLPMVRLVPHSLHTPHLPATHTHAHAFCLPSIHLDACLLPACHPSCLWEFATFCILLPGWFLPHCPVQLLLFPFPFLTPTLFILPLPLLLPLLVISSPSCSFSLPTFYAFWTPPMPAFLPALTGPCLFLGMPHLPPCLATFLECIHSLCLPLIPCFSFLVLLHFGSYHIPPHLRFCVPHTPSCILIPFLPLPYTSSPLLLVPLPGTAPCLCPLQHTPVNSFPTPRPFWCLHFVPP